MTSNYAKLLLKESMKSDYRKRPIDTLNQIEKIKKQIKEDQKNGKDRKIQLELKSTNPVRRVVAESKITASYLAKGKKAFKESVKLKKMYDDLALLKNNPTKYKEYLDRIHKLEDLERDAEKLKDEPLKYISKLAEINAFDTSTHTSTHTSNEYDTILKLLHAQIPAEKLIGIDDQFAKLNSAEQTTLLDILKNQTKGDTSTRKDLVVKFMTYPASVKKELIDTVKQLTPEKLKIDTKSTKRGETKLDKKAKQKELFEAKQKELFEEPEEEPIEEKLEKQQQDTNLSIDLKKLINKQISITKFDSNEQKDFVLYNLHESMKSEFALDPDYYSNMSRGLPLFIDNLKQRYESEKPKAINYEIAKANEDQLSSINEEHNIDIAANKARDEEVNVEIHPEIEPLVEPLIEQLQQEEHLTPSEAKSDAHEIALGVTNDLISKSVMDSELKNTDEEAFAYNLDPVVKKVKTQEEKDIEDEESVAYFNQINDNVARDVSQLIDDGENTTREELMEHIYGKKEEAQEEAKPKAEAEEEEAEEAKVDISKFTKTMINELKAPDIKNLAQKLGIPLIDSTTGKEFPAKALKEYMRVLLKESHTKAEPSKHEELTEEQSNILSYFIDTKAIGNLHRDSALKYATIFNIPTTGRTIIDIKSDIIDKYNEYNEQFKKYDEPKQVVKKVVIKKKGQGFKPLNQQQHEMIAGSLMKHYNNVKNKRQLMRVTMHNPFEDTENQGYRHRLTQNTLHSVRGGGWFDSFMTGFTAPFKVIASVL